MTQAQADLNYRDAIIAKMNLEHALDISDAEIERTLSQTVAPEFCINTAKRLRAKGLLMLGNKCPDCCDNPECCPGHADK